MAKWALNDDVKKKLEEVASELRSNIDELRGEFDDKSESWQDSDKGNEVMEWLDNTEEIVDTIEGMETSA